MVSCRHTRRRPLRPAGTDLSRAACLLDFQRRDGSCRKKSIRNHSVSNQDRQAHRPSAASGHEEVSGSPEKGQGQTSPRPAELAEAQTGRFRAVQYRNHRANIGLFKPCAKKYDLDFSLRKDNTTHPPRYIVIFKTKQADNLEQAFKEFTAKKLNRGTALHPKDPIRHETKGCGQRETAGQGEVKERGLSL